MYPRQCIDCQYTYAHPSGYSHHKSSGKCLRRQSAQATKSLKQSDVSSITTNNHDNRTIINQNINLVVSDIEALKNLLHNQDVQVSQEEQRKLSNVKNLLDEQGITDRQHLKAFIDFYSTTCNVLLDDFRERKDVIQQLTLLVPQCHALPYDDCYDDDLKKYVTIINAKPRTIMLVLATVFWQKLFLPQLDKDVLEKLIRRPVPLDTKNKNTCEVRHIMDVFGEDEETLTHAQYARKYNHDVFFDDGEMDDSRSQLMYLHYMNYTDKKTSWQRESFETTVREHLIDIHFVLCRNIAQTPIIQLHPLLQKRDIHLFCEGIMEGTTPMNVPIDKIKIIEKMIISDSQTDLVSGWRLLSDTFEQTQLASDPQSTSNMQSLDHYKRMMKFRANRPM